MSSRHIIEMSCYETLYRVQRAEGQVCIAMADLYLHELLALDGGFQVCKIALLLRRCGLRQQEVQPDSANGKACMIPAHVMYARPTYKEVFPTCISFWRWKEASMLAALRCS